MPKLQKTRRKNICKLLGAQRQLLKLEKILLQTITLEPQQFTCNCENPYSGECQDIHTGANYSSSETKIIRARATDYVEADQVLLAHP
jgi:hypothetical protein